MSKLPCNILKISGGQMPQMSPPGCAPGETVYWHFAVKRTYIFPIFPNKTLGIAIHPVQFVTIAHTLQAWMQV